MAHIHSVNDTDSHFIIDGTTRAIRNASGTKKTIVQFDHNSERLTFELPRTIEGHDITQCNVVEVHYLNIDSRTRAVRKGVCEVKDLEVSPDDESMAVCSWLISQNATQLVGPLQFLITFKCFSEGELDYAWSTGIHKQIIVTRGIANGEAVVEEYADILEQWRQEFGSGSSAPDVDLTGVVTSVNGKTPDENGNVEIAVSGGSGGMSATAANLLIDILESAVYNTNVSGKIASLKEALASGGSSGGDTPDVPDVPDVPDEPVVVDDITVADGIMTIITVGSVVNVADGVMTIA